VPHLLHLDSSADGATSVSRALTATFAQTWQARGSDFTITYRDLRTDAPPHLTDPSLHWSPALRTVGRPGSPDPDPGEVARQDTLITELVGADILLIGAPLYNWSMPSSLKAWLDYIHVLGVTTPFGGDTQPMKDRTAVIATSSGDGYGPGTGNEGKNHAVPALELVLGASLGMRVIVIGAEFTLAPLLEVLADRRPQAQADLDAAHAAARSLATDLG
jgi:FMN-dependent NADH-azoreductase